MLQDTVPRYGALLTGGTPWSLRVMPLKDVFRLLALASLTTAGCMFLPPLGGGPPGGLAGSPSGTPPGLTGTVLVNDQGVGQTKQAFDREKYEEQIAALEAKGLYGESSGLPKGVSGYVIGVPDHPTSTHSYSDAFNSDGYPRSDFVFLTNIKSRCAVVQFERATPAPGSDQVRGNGWLIGPNRILTAAHIATMVRANPSAYRLRLYASAYPTELTYRGIVVLNNTWEPDVAMVLIDPVADSLVGSVNVGPVDPPMRELVLLGADAFAGQPKAKTGWSTLRPRQRALSKTWSATVFGTNLPCFVGQSGSPVFDKSTGRLVGVFSAGEAQFKNTHEAYDDAPANEAEWEKWPKWSWVTPVAQNVDLLLARIPGGAER